MEIPKKKHRGVASGILLLWAVIQGLSPAVCMAQKAEPDSVQNDSSGSVLYFFSGSDWCVTCIRFKKQIADVPAFQDSLRLLDIRLEVVDFPQRKPQDAKTIAHNQSLAVKFKFKGQFPAFVLWKPGHNDPSFFYYQYESLPEFIEVVKAQRYKP